MTPPELFGTILCNHFLTRYKHIHAARSKIVTTRWTRMNIDGKPHPHSFLKDGDETRDVEVDMVEGKGVDIRTSIRGLTVLKSTNSEFWGYIRDEYTTLPETWDRILSTDVTALWHWKHFNSLDEVRAVAQKFDPGWTTVRDITLKTFAEDNSASVQNTMYKMADHILAAQPLIETVEYALPNKHYFELGMSPDVFLSICPDTVRSELAQGHPEHRQERRGLCAPEQPQRPDQVYCFATVEPA